MLQFNNVTISLKKDSRVLIRKFNFSLQNNDKIAIIGEEGNGKSTLLKLVSRKEEVEKYCDIEGEVNTSDSVIGYLEQSISSVWDDIPVLEFLLKDNAEDEIDINKYDYISDIFEYASKFKLNTQLLDDNRLVSSLSGGEKVKIQLIKILITNPDILLLDEPTNDLDISTLKWLEDFINKSNIPIIYISHDETLLENTANGIIHLEQLKKKSESKYTIERIGYKEYVSKRLSILTHQEQVAQKQRRDHDKQMETFRQTFQKVEHQQNTITRSDPHGAALLKKKMKSLKSQEKRYEREKEEFLDIPDVEEAIGLKNSDIEAIPNGKTVLDYHLDELKIGDTNLSNNISLTIVGPKHVVIIGQNGVGKTTLLKKIYESLKDRDDINVGYMPQNYEDTLDSNKTALDFLSPNKNKTEETNARTFMGSMKFTREEMVSRVSDLSGGQKAKLLLISLILNKNNVLILDEPTRNLSPLSNPVIRDVLAKFNGCIISISHDRKYIDEVCDYIYELTKDGLIKKSSYYDNDEIMNI